MDVVRTPDPLTVGAAENKSFYLPKALYAELKRQAAIDGLPPRKLSAYVVQLLTFAVRAREAERAAAKK